MKKLITITLIIALLLPVAALAADRDPIIGTWYMYADMGLYPEIAYAFQNNDVLLSSYILLEDGSIILMEVAMKDAQGSSNVRSVGKWRKEGDKYMLSIFGLGDNEAILDEDILKIDISATAGIPCRVPFHRAIPMNPYTDYEYNFK